MKTLPLALLFAVVACNPPAQNAQGPQYPQNGPYPYPPGYPGYAPPPNPTTGGPTTAPTTVPVAARPLLAPLVGSAAWQAEVGAVLTELQASLSAANQAKVRGIPFVLDPNPNVVNAFAGCDDSGAPFIAGTEGLLEAVDAMSQTKATDELFGTSTFQSYMQWAAPRMVQQTPVSVALPQGMIPTQYGADARRWSRAHEIFDETVAFTFGHEMGHHYLGHTGCANGQAQSGGPNPAALAHFATALIPGLNQPNEAAADTAGCINTLDAGRARRATAYAWTENGGLMLLSFFSQMEVAAGISVLNPIGFLQTHPHPELRIPLVQTVAAAWRLQHPG
jgi:Peptidase family M48